MMGASIITGPTESQRVQYARILEDIAQCATRVALDQVEADSDGWQQVLAHGDELKSSVTRAIIASTCELSVNTEWPVWRTIKIGTSDLRTANDYRLAMKAAGCRVSESANSILDQPEFTIFSEETEVDLMRVSTWELGFPEGATRTDIYARALEQGLELCPPEIGPKLRLEYGKQPTDEWFLVAMDPICDAEGYHGIWNIDHDQKIYWLATSDDFVNFWYPSSQWVFVRRNNS